MSGSAVTPLACKDDNEEYNGAGCGARQSRARQQHTGEGGRMEHFRGLTVWSQL